MSVKHESLINTEVIPTSSLKDIWIKAKKLLFTAGLVVPVPRQPCSQNRMVASEHNKPHDVAYKVIRSVYMQQYMPTIFNIQFVLGIINAMMEFKTIWPSNSNLCRN